MYSQRPQKDVEQGHNGRPRLPARSLWSRQLAGPLQRHHHYPGQRSCSMEAAHTGAAPTDDPHHRVSGS